MALKDVATALDFGSAFHETTIFSPSTDATTPVGIFGTGAGLIEADGREEMGFPFLGVATMTKV